MRRGLLWAFCVTLVLSVVALWKDQAPSLVSAVARRTGEPAEAVALSGGASSSSLTTGPLPEEIPRLSIEAAKRDMFVPYQTPASGLASPPVASVAAVAVAPPPIPPAPQAPAANLSFLGFVTTPEGKRLVYLQGSDSALAVTVGQRLDNGYVVESITSEAVTLLYPPLDVRVSVPIPPTSPR